MPFVRDKETLIEAVRLRPGLWSKSSHIFTTREEKQQLWKEVALICNSTDYDAHRTWKNMNDTFRRNNARCLRAEQEGLTAKSSFRYAKELSFLLDPPIGSARNEKLRRRRRIDLQNAAQSQDGEEDEDQSADKSLDRSQNSREDQEVAIEYYEAVTPINTDDEMYESDDETREMFDNVTVKMEIHDDSNKANSSFVTSTQDNSLEAKQTNENRPHLRVRPTPKKAQEQQASFKAKNNIKNKTKKYKIPKFLQPSTSNKTATAAVKKTTTTAVKKTSTTAAKKTTTAAAATTATATTKKPIPTSTPNKDTANGAQEQEEQNDDYFFMMSLLPIMKRLPMVRKCIIRSKIQQMLCEEVQRLEN